MRMQLREIMRFYDGSSIFRFDCPQCSYDLPVCHHVIFKRFHAPQLFTGDVVTVTTPRGDGYCICCVSTHEISYLLSDKIHDLNRCKMLPPIDFNGREIKLLEKPNNQVDSQSDQPDILDIKTISDIRTRLSLVEDSLRTLTTRTESIVRDLRRAGDNY